MTRHGRNATNAAVYSYHERRKDAKESGWGSEKARFSKDSVKGFDCCSLMLQVRFSQIVKEFTNQIYICTSENFRILEISSSNGLNTLILFYKVH